MRPSYPIFFLQCFSNGIHPKISFHPKGLSILKFLHGTELGRAVLRVDNDYYKEVKENFSCIEIIPNLEGMQALHPGY